MSHILRVIVIGRGGKPNEVINPTCRLDIIQSGGNSIVVREMLFLHELGLLFKLYELLRGNPYV